ncbi:hypothetical protein BDEG_23340 [Batrachochytrium dendrobatidis JEL423]|uniref:UBC core domain-containing protein n=1 Tax=Batrachochytrium dendrobatidis (strain JEL423) TaxID=403673 RepID=A0A177WJH5_BATDL|nr:hypothetical protein BDEG_23340 [Batrachochytrium dendrobatidis JEL423]
MASKGAYKRLTKEFMLIQASPTPFIVAKPLDNNILEWHYILTGPPNSLYEGGQYHGKLNFPSDYPYKLEDHATTGSITTSSAEKRQLASKSKKWNLSSPKFKEVFPEVCREMEEEMNAKAAGQNLDSSKSTKSLSSARMSSSSCQLSQRHNSTGAVVGSARGSETEPARLVAAPSKKPSTPWSFRSHTIGAVILCLALYLITVKIFSRTQ